MRGLFQQWTRLWRFLRGQSISQERDRIKRGLVILTLSVVIGVLLLVGILAVTTPKNSNGSALLAPTPTQRPTDTPTQMPTPTPTNTPVPSVPQFSHIFEIVLENTSYDRLVGSPQAPYFNSLAQQYGLATQFYAVTHPSLPNYFVLTAGDLLGVTDDCDQTTASCKQTATNLTDTIEQSGRTWVAYFESMPAPCDTTRAFPYTIHYNPFVYYTDIVQNGQRCQSHVLPYNQGQFFAELSAGQVPNFVWISPDLTHDMHEGYGTIAQSDQWLSSNVAQILASPAFQQNGLLIITFDEGDDASSPDTNGCCGATPGGGHVATLLISPLVRKGFQSSIAENQYNLVSTIEDAWGLPRLGGTKNAQSMTEFFGSSPTGNLSGGERRVDTVNEADSAHSSTMVWFLAGARPSGVLKEN
jgi:hypothetical protein